MQGAFRSSEVAVTEKACRDRIDRGGCTCTFRRDYNHPNQNISLQVYRDGSSPTRTSYVNFETPGAAKYALKRITEMHKKRELPNIFVYSKFTCKAKSDTQRQGNSSDSDCDSDEDAADTFVEHIIESIKQSSYGYVYLAQIGTMAKKYPSWSQAVENAGGVKGFCLDHEDKLQFVADGGCGYVRQVSACTLEIGAKVEVKPGLRPSNGWGMVFPWSIGMLREKNGAYVTVDFHEQEGWKGLASELQASSGVDASKADIDREDPLFDQYGFVRNLSQDKAPSFNRRFKCTGQNELQIGFVHAAESLTPERPYFEVRLEALTASGAVVAIGLSGPKYFAGKHAGWKHELPSMGMHSDDGKLFFPGCDVEGLPVCEASEDGDVLGCGVIFNTSKAPEAVCFTRNGVHVARVPVLNDEKHMIYPIVTCKFSCVFETELQAQMPSVQEACSWQEAEREGKSQTYSSLASAFASKAAGIITIHDVGVHVLRQNAEIRTSTTIRGLVSATGAKPTVAKYDGHILSIFADSTVTDICLKSFGGNSDLRVGEGGTASVMLYEGKLLIESCILSCEKGTCVATDDSTSHYLDIRHCSIGPAGRHGCVICSSASMEHVTLNQIAQIALAMNPHSSAVFKFCKVANCQIGAKNIQWKDAAYKDCVISDCQYAGFEAVFVKNIKRSELKTSFSGCRIEGCGVALSGSGSNISISFDKSNTIAKCTRTNKCMDGAIIHIDEECTRNNERSCDLVATFPAVVRRDSKDPGQADASLPSSDTHNFVRFCRLMLGLTPRVLSSLFKTRFKATIESGEDWSASHAVTILDQIDDYGKRRLGKAALDKIVEGNCEEWDITLLASLLLIKPGYMADVRQAKEAIDSIRQVRNSMMHSNLLAKQSMPGDEYESCWKTITRALEALIDCLPQSDRESCHTQIKNIATEVCQLSEVEAVTDAFRQEMREIAETAREKAEEALKATEKAATKSEVERIVIARFESLLNARGKLDLSKLPDGLRDVELNNGKKYRLLSEVGRGGMGTVFRAVPHDDIEQQVAFKVCETTSPDRAEREVTILEKLAKLRHGNIVRFLDSSTHESHVVIIMELIKGESVEDWLTKRYAPKVGEVKPVTWQESQGLMTQLASGMAAIHDMSIAHRDLKPQNLMIDEATGKLIIVDFGLSKQHNANSTMTMGHGQLGTMLYMSPEQLECNVRDISCQADVWAMGIIWHELLTYFTPFEPAASSTTENDEASSSGSSARSRSLTKKQESMMITRIFAASPRNLPLLAQISVPEQIVRIIGRCLEPEKRKRYERAGDMLEHMKDVFEEIDNKLKLEKAGQSVGQSGAAGALEKPFKDWSVEEVAGLLRDVCKCVDTPCFCMSCVSVVSC